MNTLVIVLIAAVCLLGAYTLYGRWLAKKWGIDPKAKTPAVNQRGRPGLCSHQRLGGIRSPVLIHCGRRPCDRRHPGCRLRLAARYCCGFCIGGIFFGAVTDFGALYASVKNDGKSMGTADREVHRQDRPQAVPAVLLAVLPADRHRSLRRHGRRNLQRLHRQWMASLRFWPTPAQYQRRRRSMVSIVLHGLRGGLRISFRRSSTSPAGKRSSLGIFCSPSLSFAHRHEPAA